MKSFADWTQELAESVGEIKHHWETDDQPGWPVPPPPVVRYCEVCGVDAAGHHIIAYSYTAQRIRTLCSPCYITGSY